MAGIEATIFSMDSFWVGYEFNKIRSLRSLQSFDPCGLLSHILRMPYSALLHPPHGSRCQPRVPARPGCLKALPIPTSTLGRAVPKIELQLTFARLGANETSGRNRRRRQDFTRHVTSETLVAWASLFEASR